MAKRILEYRARDDDGWYSVNVAVKSDTLTIEFQGFPEADKFVASQFESEADIDSLVGRFRVVSPQLQDNECGSITEGSVVCAACPGNDDMRYYDAVVEAVHRKDHSLVNGEEECLCIFVLSWLHGPKRGLLTNVDIAAICTIKDDGKVDEKIASFSKLAKDKFQVSSCKATAISENKASAGSMFAKGGSHLSIDQKDIQNGLKLIDGKGETKGTMSNHDPHQDQDKDLGGETSNNHFILIGNLERNLSPSSIREFIYRHTSISPQAYILPSPLSTPFARAVIMLDCKKKHEKVYQFLDNPDHFVVSMRGRPWVVIESVSKHGMLRTSLGSLVRKFQEKCEGNYFDNELMVVRSGTEAYRCAQQLRDLFMDFSNHEQLLYKRLVEEEMRIMQPFLSNNASM